MHDTYQAARIASLIQTRSEEADRELANFFRRTGREAVVARLLLWEDAAVRFWAIAAAERVYSREEYAEVLERAAGDPDDDVSADAIDRLLNVAPDRAQRMSRSIAVRLSSEGPLLDKVFWLWSLARLRARQAVPEIKVLRAGEEDWTKLARVADVVLTYLSEGERVILEAIESHRDHAHVEELCTLAWFVIRNEAARSALEVCAAEAPDEDCRKECQFSLEKLKKAR